MGDQRAARGRGRDAYVGAALGGQQGAPLRSGRKPQPEKQVRGSMCTSWCGSDKEPHPGLETAENQCSANLEARA